MPCAELMCGHIVYLEECYSCLLGSGRGNSRPRAEQHCRLAAWAKIRIMNRPSLCTERPNAPW